MATSHALESKLVLQRHAPEAHHVQFYREESVLIRSVVEHLAVSLRNGGSAVVLATETHRGRILEQLARLGIPGDVLLRRFIAFDPREALSKFMVDGWPEAARFRELVEGLLSTARSAAAETLLPVAAFGEMVAILWAEGNKEAAVQLEQLWSEFTQVSQLSLLCAYPLAYFSRTEDRHLFAAICGEHSAVVPAESQGARIADDETAREIADLQQRAESLALEVEARRQAEEKLRAAHAELENLVEQRTTALRKLSLQVLKLQDLERRRIARELHDSLGQDFVALRVNLDLARKSPEHPGIWKECDQLLDRCIDEVRTLSYLLHPPMIEDAGFGSAARWYIEDFSRRSGMKITFASTGDIGRLPENLKLVLFRVLQESLMNVYRHAHASSGQVRVDRQGSLIILEIKDNGVGIPAEKLVRFNRNGTGMGVGLTGMRERVRDLGGRFELSSSYQGTTVKISVPTARRS
jgi:signal transduction histidine kinase